MKKPASINKSAPIPMQKKIAMGLKPTVKTGGPSTKNK